MRIAATTARIAPVLTALSMLFIATAATSASTHSSGGTEAGGWLFVHLAPAARANFLAATTQTIPAAQPVLRAVRGQATVDGENAPCAPAWSCSGPDNGGPRVWRIRLDSWTVSGTYPSQRFLELHEVGHEVWWLEFTPADRAAFVTAVRQSLHGAPCRMVNHPDQPCAAVTEMFADEFARWAGGFAHSMTKYETPPLLDAHTFGALVAGAMARQHAAA
jgi:hypothetical protein